jgi:hypothetical protein
MKMIAVFVVSCPCAVSLCVPMVVVIAVSVAAKKGILFKVGRVKFWIVLRIPLTLPFALVETSPSSLSNTQGYHRGSLRQDRDAHGRKPLGRGLLPTCRRRCSVGIPSHKTSTHPVAKAVTEYAHSLVSSSTTAPKLGTITSVAGQGLETKLGQRTLRGGNCRWLNLGSIPMSTSSARNVERSSRSRSMGSPLLFLVWLTSLDPEPRSWSGG